MECIWSPIIGISLADEVSRVLPSLVMEDIASPRPKVAAHVTGSYASTVEMEEGGEFSSCFVGLSLPALWYAFSYCFREVYHTCVLCVNQTQLKVCVCVCA